MIAKRIVHLSDLHADIERIKGLKKAILKRHPECPTIITGDLTNHSTEYELRKTREALEGLRVVPIPGNHDIAWFGNINHRQKNWGKYFGSPFGWNRPETSWMVDGVGAWEDGEIVYIGVDSTDPEDKQICARGYIGTKQAQLLKKTLRWFKGKTRVVCLHHHPFTSGIFTKLHGSIKFLKAISGNCEIVLFGHEHEYGLWSGKNGVPLFVSSHKSTNTVSGNCLMITIIDIHSDGNFHHYLEVA